jgi:hypothetical protein
MTLEAREPDAHGWIATETVRSRFGDFEFRNGFPTPDAADRLYELRTFNRAVEACLAHIAGVSMFHMRKGMRDAGIDAAHKLLISEDLFDARSLFLTASTAAVYGLGFLDLERDGPTVVEAPPAVLGLVVDMWNRYVADIGQAGPDGGEGGKYLFLPPDYRGRAPGGYCVVRSPTYGGWMCLRGLVAEGEPPDRAADLLKTTRCYPLASAADPPAMLCLNGSGTAIDTLWPDSCAFFESLAELMEQEPAEALTSAQRFYPALIGIEKGKPFAPDARTRELLAEAARVGSALARALTFASRDPETRVYPDRRWECVGGSHARDANGHLDPDRSAPFSSAATGSSPAMVSQAVGVGSQSFFATRDASGAYLDGGRSYRLRLPPGVPVERSWSVVVYDALSRSELQNGEGFPSVSRYAGPVTNDDGSVDVYFGPLPPTGRERNWIRTMPGKGWFPYLRFYGPTQAFFDRTWKPDDIVEVT